MMEQWVDDDDDYETPLQYKRPFGAGLKRKRIDFVAQSSANTAAIPSANGAKGSAREAYLSIVFPKASDNNAEATTEKEQEESRCQSGQAEAAEAERPEENNSQLVCPICNLPTSVPSSATAGLPHQASLAHQICLEHSHPPSSIDRRRKGLTYLQSYGWDPDARKGLGATGDGRLYPVRAEQKQGNTGIGAEKVGPKEETKKTSMTHKERKEAEDKAKKKAAKMRDLFYSRDEVNKYLGVEL